ncbi:MAG: hypothetical protein ACP5JG_16140 [Anaerolineae bacterium]
METYIDGNMLARTIASEKTRERREPIVLAYPGIRLRSAMTWVNSAVEGIRGFYEMLGHAMTVEVKSFNYCTMNPSEC